MGEFLRKAVLAAVLIALFVLPIQTFAQDYLYDQWGVKEGLPQNTINQILQTSDGYIWLATEGGVARFDGMTFTNFDVANTPELNSNRINALYENANGDLLIGSYRGGLTVYRDNQFYNLSDVPALKNQSIYKFTPGTQNHLWIFASDKDRLLVIDATTYEPLPVENPLKRDGLYGFYPSNDGYHFVRKEYTGTLDTAFEAIPTKPNVKLKFDIRAATIDEANRTFWVLDEENLYHCPDYTCSEAFKIPFASFRWNNVPLITKVGNQIFIVSVGSPDLLVFDIPEQTYSVIETNKICPNGTIIHVYADKEDNLWFATSICGLIKVKPPRFTYVGGDDDHSHENCYPIQIDDQNRLLIGTLTNHIYIFDEESQFIERPDFLPTNRAFVSSIEKFNGDIYYSTVIYNHILHWKNETVTPIYFPDSLPRYTNAIFATQRNELLVGTETGIFHLVDDKLEQHPLSSKINIANVINFYEDVDDRLWVVADQKVVCYNRETGAIEFNSEDFSPEHRFYRGIYGDAEGRIYVGSYGFGLNIIDGQHMHRLTTEQGLAENVVSTITEDSNGYIWFTGNIGLSRIKKSELLDVLSGNRKKLSTVLYNEQTDGLRTGEFNGGIQQSKCWLGGERYVFPSMKGAVIVDFADMQFNTLPPPVHIEKLSYNDSTILAEAAVEMPYADGRLDIFYTALSYVSPKNVRFKYQLEGYDEDWIDAGAERKTSYSKIPPGEYTFRVIASNNEGVWNEKGSQMDIHIIPPYHMTWWFRWGMILFGFLLTVWAVSRIIAFRRKRERDKSALMDILPDLVFKMNRNGHFLDIYGNPENLTKPIPRTGERLIDDLLPGGLTPEAQQFIDRAFETGAMQEHTYEVNGEKTFESRYIAIDRHEVLCIIRDITEAKEAERQIRKSEKKLFKALEKEKELLKAITRQQKMQLEAIVNTEEKERKRIARDLHDGVGQLLSSVKINLGVVKEYIAKSKVAETTELVDKSRIAIDEITEELRNISYNLLPPSLEQFGLASAIAEEVNKLKSNPELFVHFDNSTTDLKFDPKVEIVLFRVFQELLNNALKHAQASEITIQLIQHKAELVMMIEDNGRGFELRSSVEKKDSSGLKNLYSRIAFIDGKISVDSTPHSGTSIIIEIPLKS